MATEYNATAVVGTSYPRVFEVNITYPDGELPAAIMRREMMYVLSDTQKISRPMRPLKIAFNPTKEYPLLNPETGEPLGATTTLQNLFVELYSIFITESEAEAAYIESKLLEMMPDFNDWILTFPEEERESKKTEMLERLRLI